MNRDFVMDLNQLTLPCACIRRGPLATCEHIQRFAPWHANQGAMESASSTAFSKEARNSAALPNSNNVRETHLKDTDVGCTTGTAAECSTTTSRPDDSFVSRPSLPNGKRTRGRVKIKLEFILNRLKRQSTFSKRKNGMLKKAKELAILTGAQVLMVVVNEAGNVHSYTSKKLEGVMQSKFGKDFLQKYIDGASGIPDSTPLARLNTEAGTNDITQQQSSGSVGHKHGGTVSLDSDGTRICRSHEDFEKRQEQSETTTSHFRAGENQRSAGTQDAVNTATTSRDMPGGHSQDLTAALAAQQAYRHYLHYGFSSATALAGVPMPEPNARSSLQCHSACCRANTFGCLPTHFQRAPPCERVGPMTSSILRPEPRAAKHGIGFSVFPSEAVLSRVATDHGHFSGHRELL